MVKKRDRTVRKQRFKLELNFYSWGFENLLEPFIQTTYSIFYPRRLEFLFDCCAPLIKSILMTEIWWLKALRLVIISDSMSIDRHSLI